MVVGAGVCMKKAHEVTGSKESRPAPWEMTESQDL